MAKREALDISAYLVVGPENTQGRPVREIVRAAVLGGFTCVQLRSKEASARALIALCGEVAQELEKLGAKEKVALLVDDRLDVVLAAREQGFAVDGIHVGQKDIPPEVCRKYLGEAAIVGLSAPIDELFSYIENTDLSAIDYFGAGPLHPTETKKDAGINAKGEFKTRSLSDLTRLAKVSPVPVVVGGGVKAADLPELKKTGVNGFFVVSAIAGVAQPQQAAEEMSGLWRRL